MSTQPKPSYFIKANHLGPVFTLEGEFSKRDQNIVFARNGTGKSFLTRGFRYLDMFGQSADISDAATNLVSDESSNGKGSFKFLSGTEVLGEIDLEKGKDAPIANVHETIFHVFSEEFVEKELRERTYQISGEIEHQIAVDSKSIELDEAKNQQTKAETDQKAIQESLEEKFESEKIVELSEKAEVNKRLNEFRELSLEKVLKIHTEIPEIPDKNFSEALLELDKLKSIPAEPIYPKPMNSFSTNNANLEAIRLSLAKVTSPSSVSELIKKKIDSDREFYETGLSIITSTKTEECPFCEQDISLQSPKDVIDTYVKYFNAEEEKHKSELRVLYRNLTDLEKEIVNSEGVLNTQNNEFERLKSFIPSQKDKVLDNSKTNFDTARDAVTALKDAIQSKAGTLAVPANLPQQTFIVAIRDLNKAIESNNVVVEALNNAVMKSDDERKKLQRSICKIFETEFAITNWAEIEKYKSLKIDLKDKSDKLLQLEKTSPSSDARTRVAETFDLLLKQFFPGKYVFNKDTFILKRGEYHMTRGPHRTLSDGEKTAIAFCYFIACIHRKVTANSDYQRMFLVFDDPVTSMSYDFIFTIAQTLKNLNISNAGEISINPSLINGSKYKRPRLLILTHSSYFFNITTTNRVVESNAAFSLHCEKDIHKLTKMAKYVAPFQEQLKEVYSIANGQSPDHRTANSIRSVLEAVGRFCRPDKSDSLSNFVQFLAGTDGIEIKSVLINTLSHGTYLEEIPPPDDLVLACKETLTVVEKYACGQLEIIKSALEQ